VDFNCATFDVLTEDLHFARSVPMAAVSYVTWGIVQNRET